MLAAELGSLRPPGADSDGAEGPWRAAGTLLGTLPVCTFFLNLRQDLSRSMVTLRLLQSSWLTAWAGIAGASLGPRFGSLFEFLKSLY